MTDNRRLEIVDEKGNVIAIKTREEIHREGLLHREINVWFYTPAGEIIFQHRAKDKDTYPDLLDATVGGHVEMGEEYIDTVIKETLEETGLVLDKKAFQFIKVTHHNTFDPVTNRKNNALNAKYIYRYDGGIKDLKIERDKAVGFEAWPIDKLLNVSLVDKKKFLPSIFSPEVLDIFRDIDKKVKNEKTFKS